MNESVIAQVEATVAWPLVVAFAGFVGRFRYCVGNALTDDQICVKNVFSCLLNDNAQSKKCAEGCHIHLKCVLDKVKEKQKRRN